MIAALYVATGGCYFGLPSVEPWDQERDARKYRGPWPVAVGSSLYEKLLKYFDPSP